MADNQKDKKVNNSNQKDKNVPSDDKKGLSTWLGQGTARSVANKIIERQDYMKKLMDDL